MFNVSGAKKGSVYTFEYPCGDEKTTCYPYVGIIPHGSYRLEVFGAEGGRAGDKNGGYGGYSTGILRLFYPAQIFLYVGARGISSSSDTNATAANTFNGGGSGMQSPTQYYTASSGGGSSDIRINKDDIYHRLIVAGAGGGTGRYGVNYWKGGNGGGENGTKGTTTYATSSQFGGSGATQLSGNLFYGENRTDWDGCGGGGGLYGGGSGKAYNNPGGGGSGFVFNKESQSIATSAMIVLEKSYYLYNARTSTSDHTGDGKIVITVLTNLFCETRNIKNSINMPYFIVFIIRS